MEAAVESTEVRGAPTYAVRPLWTIPCPSVPSLAVGRLASLVAGAQPPTLKRVLVRRPQRNNNRDEAVRHSCGGGRVLIPCNRSNDFFAGCPPNVDAVARRCR